METIVIGLMLFGATAHADLRDTRRIPAHAHMDDAGFVKCDSGYGPTDSWDCAPIRLRNPKDVTSGLNTSGGQFIEYFPEHRSDGANR